MSLLDASPLFAEFRADIDMRRCSQAAKALLVEHEEQGWENFPLDVQGYTTTNMGYVVVIKGNRGSYAATLLIRLILEMVRFRTGEHPSYQVTWAEVSGLSNMCSGGFYNIRPDGSVWGLAHDLCESVEDNDIALAEYAPALC